MTALAPGSVLGRYEILGPLGAGGMGRVYRARDRRLDRTVAVKVLPEEVTRDPERLARFEREARAAAAIEHPNLLAVYDVGTHDGAPYLVTELLDGETLGAAIRRGQAAGASRPLPPRRALEIAAALARGLAAAHARGIVHRDLKPENVFLTRDGRVKILDFGLAKLRPAADAEGETLLAGGETGAGVLLGTPGYMAPEQVRGEEVDHRADLFALGVILYEMVAGRPAFAGDTAPEVLTAVLREEPPELAAVAPGLPPELDRIIRHCLEKGPEARFQSASDLAFDLESLVAPSGAPAAPATTAGVTAAEPRRRRWVVGAALLGVALLAVALWFVLREEPAPAPLAPDRLAVFPFAVRGAGEIGYLAEGMVDLLSSALDGVGSLTTVDPHALLAALGESDRREGPPPPAAARQVAARLGAPLYILGSVVAAGDRMEATATLYEEGEKVAAAEAEAASEEEIFSLVGALARELVAGRFQDPGERLARLGAETTGSVEALKAYLAGERAFRGGRWGEAKEAFERAIAADPDFALAHYRLAAAAVWFEEEPEVAIAASSRALALAERLSPRERELLAALDAYVRGRADEAEDLYRELVRRYPEEVEAWYGLGEVLAHHNPPRGRPKFEMEEPFRRALELDPEHSASLYHLTQAAAQQGKVEELQRLSRRYLEKFADSPTAVRVKAWRALLSGDEKGWEALVTAAAEGMGERLGVLVWTAGFELRRPEMVAPILERAVDDPRAPRRMVLWHLTMLELARGRPAAADLWLERLDRQAEETEGPAGVVSLLFPFLPRRQEELAELHRRLEAWSPPERWEWDTHGDQAALFRLYWLGQTEVRLGWADAARERLRSLDSAEVEGEAARVAPFLAASLRGQIAAAAGDLEEALELLPEEHLEAPARMVNDSYVYAATEARFLRAELLYALQRDEEALPLYRSVDETCCYDSPVYSPWTHLRRAEIHDRQGRRERAAWHYEKFAAMWRDAEPALRPNVEAAERRLARLGSAGG